LGKIWEKIDILENGKINNINKINLEKICIYIFNNLQEINNNNKFNISIYIIKNFICEMNI
jgi:hypothetical protein